MTQHKLVVISLDSMGFRDLNELRELTPNLAALIDQGAWVKRVQGIFFDIDLPVPHLDHHRAVSRGVWDCQ